MIARDGVAFAVLDDSEVKKPAALRWEGPSKVRTAFAARLQRADGGPPPPRPTLMPGFGWVAVVVTGLTCSLTLARLRWFSPTAFAPERRGEAERRTVLPFLLLWAARVIWVVDRGFGNARFLGEVFARARFVARWRRDYLLAVRASGEAARASALSHRVSSQWTRQVWDPWTQQTRTVGIASLPVDLPGDERPLWLVVAGRKGKAQTLWLLTTEDASTEEGTCFVVQASTRRWRVERAALWGPRFHNSGPGIVSVRVESWTYREKLWHLAALVRAFLLALLVPLDQDKRARAPALVSPHRQTLSGGRGPPSIACATPSPISGPPILPRSLGHPKVRDASF